MQDVTKLSCILSACLALTSCDGRMTEPYVTNMVNPFQQLTACRYSNTISAANVYITGPKRSYDLNVNLRDLFSKPPIFATTDDHEIRKLVEALSDYNMYPEGPSSSTHGYTCHIILVNTKRMSAMHFRVFIPESGLVGSSVEVYPRSYNGCGYQSFKLVPWLKGILPKDGPVRIITNGPPATR